MANSTPTAMSDIVQTFTDGVTFLSPTLVSTGLNDYTQFGTPWNASSAPNSTNGTRGNGIDPRGLRAQIIFLSVILLLIIVGNVCVLVAIFVSKQGHRSRMNFFIMNLAFADLATALGAVLVELIWRVTVEWHAGIAMCKIVKFIQNMVTYASTFVLVALSIDRLDAIARPMSFTGSGTRAKILIALAWLFAAVAASPVLALATLGERFGMTQCHLKIYNWKLYLTLVAVVVFFIPTLIIALSYVVIIVIICRKSVVPKQSVRSVRGQNAKGTCRDSKKQCVSDCSSSSRGIIPQAKIRTTKMTLLIVIAFIVCWSPFFIFNLLTVYGPARGSPQIVHIVVQCLSWLNSLANPIIYGIFSTRICRHLRKFRGCDWLMEQACCCLQLNRPLRQPSMYNSNSTTYTSIEGSTRKKSLNRNRRQSGPPIIRPTLTEKENQILLKNIESDHQKHLHLTPPRDA